jgi:phosphatidylglycerol lysyltransferase
MSFMTTLSIDAPVDASRPSVQPVALPPAEFARRWGRSSVSPFVVGAEREVVQVADTGLAGYVRRGRWAVCATDPVVVPGFERAVLDEVLAEIDRRNLRPVVVSATDPMPYQERGLFSMSIADDPLVELGSFGLAGKRMASIRHSVTSARRCGVRIVSGSEAVAAGAEAVSRHWLAGKRGGELGFTLGRLERGPQPGVDWRVALDRDDRVVGFVTWHHYDDGRARVLDLMRRDPHGPNPTMDLLIAESLLEFAAAGVSVASLGGVPRSHGRLAERVYPTVSLRRFKDKFAPVWEPRYLVAPSTFSLPGALMAIGRAYCPNGLVGALRRND